MALVSTVCVIEAEHTPIIDSQQVGQKEGQIVANDLVFRVDPDFFSDHTDSTGTPKFVLQVGVLAKPNLSGHALILVQVMHLTQQLELARAHTKKARCLAGLSCKSAAISDTGVFDNVLPNGLILLLFADRLGQRYSQHVFDTAGVVDAHILDLIRCQILLDALPIFSG